MTVMNVKNFNLSATIESGQMFRWEKLGQWHYVSVGDSIIRIKQDGSKLIYRSSSDFDIASFFGLDDESYYPLLKELGRHGKGMAAAVSEHHGLRIIRQQPWECTASFICSSFSNIKRIRQNLNALAKAYGDELQLGSYSSYSFPSAASIAKNPEKLEECGLGYRAKYVAQTASIVASGFDFEKIRRSSYEDAKELIMQLPGVGSKVADCILLFSLGFPEAFPVDVWIERIMRQNYLGNAKMPIGRIAEYGRQRFGKNAGYAQQFLYHYARSRNIT